MFKDFFSSSFWHIWLVWLSFCELRTSVNQTTGFPPFICLITLNRGWFKEAMKLVWVRTGEEHELGVFCCTCYSVFRPSVRPVCPFVCLGQSCEGHISRTLEGTFFKLCPNVNSDKNEAFDFGGQRSLYPNIWWRLSDYLLGWYKVVLQHRMGWGWLVSMLTSVSWMCLMWRRSFCFFTFCWC